MKWIFGRRLGWCSCCLALAISITIAPAARADSPTLLGLLEALRDNGTIDAETYDRLVRALADPETDAGPPPAANGDAKRGVEVRVGEGGLTVESADGAFGFELGGRIHVDAARYSAEDATFGDGTELRRIRLAWEGTLREWGFKGQVDFAGDEVSLKSTYLYYTGFQPATIQIGKFKEAYSLERLMSSNSTTFMERAAPSTVFAPGRNIGLAVETHGGGNELLDATRTATVGLFSIGENDGEAQDEGWSVTARGTLAPAFAKNRFVHLGAALSLRDFNETNTLDFAERPESHLTGVRLVDTGDLTDLDDEIRYGLEAATVLGPFSIQGEYMGNRLGQTGPDLQFKGWYVYGSWILTGESRRYDARGGIFRGVRPERPPGEGGCGAWEVAARYSYTDLTDGSVIGGEQKLLTLGLNWYVNRNIRFMLNWVDVLEVDRPGDPLDGVEPGILQARAQINF